MTAPEQRPHIVRLSRRDFLRSAALGGAGLFGASLLACSDNGDGGPSSPTAEASATAGGKATASAPNMTWTALTPSGPQPDARTEHSLVTDGTRLFLFGGRGQEPMNDLWTYDIAANAWTQLSAPDGPRPLFGHNAIWDTTRSKLVVFGGQNGSTFYNDLWEFDPMTNQWLDPFATAHVGLQPAARYGAAACLDDAGHMLITHGQTPSGRVDDTWQFDLASPAWANISPAAGDKRPTKRALIDGVWDTRKRRLLIYGGQSDDAPYLDDLWGWIPEIADWQQIAREPRPSARAMYSNVYDDAQTAAYLFGGRTSDGPVNDTWVYFADGENWIQGTPTGQVPNARYGHDAAIAPGGSIFIFGGTDGTATFDDLWRLEIGS
jgi:hypothetical protein